MTMCNEKPNRIIGGCYLLPYGLRLLVNLFSPQYMVASGIACNDADSVTTFPNISSGKLTHQPLQVQALPDPYSPYKNGRIMQQK